MAEQRRRSYGEDGIYFDHAGDCRDDKHHRLCPGRWRGVVSQGYGPGGRRLRSKVSGKSRTEVRDKLKTLHRELDAGVRSSATYTVRQCIEDWLLTLGDKAATTQTNYGDSAAHMIKQLGSVKLKELTARDVQAALERLTTSLSTRSLQLAKLALMRAIRHAEFNDLVMRNVAALVTAPKGKPGRPSKSLTLDQAMSLLDVARTHRLYAYVAVSLLSGIRTEEARALTWTDVDLAAGVIYVIRSVRLDGDTKTRKSRRGLRLPQRCVQALRDHKLAQARDRAQAGSAWQEHDLVFATAVGTPLDAANVRRAFKAITKAAGLGQAWTPRELRHSFVSLLSDSGVSLGDIADAVGHSSTRTTEEIYRHQLKPVLQVGALSMDRLFPGTGELGSHNGSQTITS